MGRPIHLRRALIIGGIVFALIIAADAVILATHWPFYREAAIGSFEHATGSKVRIGQFHRTYLPRPGYIAQNVLLERSGGSGSSVKLATIQTVRCFMSWPMILSLTHCVQTIRLEGLKVTIPPQIPPDPPRKSLIETTVANLVADGASLDIAPRSPGGEDLRFEFPQLRVDDLVNNKPFRFQALIKSSTLDAVIRARGNFGPLQTARKGDTPLSGVFNVARLNLGQIQSIQGLLTGTGKFHGTLSHVEVDGSADVPNFEVKSSRHAVDLSGDYATVVNGLNGAVAIDKLTARWMQINLQAHGGVSDKTVSLDIQAQHAPVGDLFYLFVSGKQPPLTGPITFQAHVTLPPGKQEFLRRVKLTGVFDIEHASFTHPDSQEKVDELSARTRPRGSGDSRSDPRKVTADLSARVNLRDGTATFSNDRFQVPGAKADLDGTYSLLTQAVDLNGTLAMQASLSHAAGGLKSVLLIPLDPFFRKGNAGAVVAVHIGGTYSHPAFKLSLRK